MGWRCCQLFIESVIVKKIVIAAVVCAMLAGCAAPSSRGYGAAYTPVIDMRPGQSQAQHDADLAACQAHARKVMDAQTAAVAGAIAGALIGAALGAAAGGGSKFNTRMAGVGAIGGGLSTGAEAEGGQRGIIVRCMAGRGYNVLQ